MAHRVSYNQEHLIRDSLTYINKGRYIPMEQQELKHYLSVFEMVMQNHLREAADKETEVTVKPFRGLQLEAKFMPEQEKIMYGKKITTIPKIFVKTKLSKYFKNVIMTHDDKGGLICL